MSNGLISLHDRFFGAIERGLSPWLPGLLARLLFAAVLLIYFLNSAATKLGGDMGHISVTDNAWVQILPTVMEQYGYDSTQIPFFPWGVIVYLGTYSELILPVLLVIGLFTRLAAGGMVVFVLVQSYVDIAFHGVDEKTIGAWFDRFPDAVIMDQRALWLFPLIYLVIRGAGTLSLDALLTSGRRKSRD